MRGSVRDERGQAALLLAGVVAVAGLVCVGLGLVGRAAVDQARARTAADAAALAGALAGEAEAAAVARANGAVLVRFTTIGADAEVEVRAGRARAVARARREGGTRQQARRAPETMRHTFYTSPRVRPAGDDDRV
jgi:hypothetical protein